MKLVFLFVVLIYITQFGYGQLEIPFQVKTLDYTTQKKETGVTVKAFDAGILLSTVVSNSSGIAKVSLPAGKKYKLEISKPGKVTRFVIVDLTKVTEEALDNGVDPTGGVDMSLFEDVKDLDYSYVAQNPATNFSFDPEEGMKFDVDIAKKTITPPYPKLLARHLYDFIRWTEFYFYGSLNLLFLPAFLEQKIIYEKVDYHRGCIGVFPCLRICSRFAKSKTYEVPR